MVHQPRDELHRHVLEGQGRPVEQFQQVFAITNFLQGQDVGRIEGRIGILDQGLQIRRRNGVADEGRHDLLRQGRIGQILHGADVVGGKLRPGFGHVKAAVAREAGQQDVLETKRGGFTPRGDVSGVCHVRALDSAF